MPDRPSLRPTTPAIAALLKLGQVPSGPPFKLIDLHVDHLGSTRVTTDEYGAIVTQHDFFPFGEEILPVPDESTKMFTGHERDDETGLDYMMARYYESGIARFLASDPKTMSAERLRAPQRLNLYAYAANNPMKFIDPTGADITVPQQSGHKAVEKMMVETVRRPSGRDSFLKVAQNKDFNLVVTDARLQKTSDAQLAKDKGGSVTFEKIPRAGAVDRTGDGKIDQAQMQVDTKAVEIAHDDPSGVTTTVHGLHHAEALMDQGTYEAGLQGDQPTSETGPAEQAGQAAAQEKPDMSKKDAKKIVDANIKR